MNLQNIQYHRSASIDLIIRVVIALVLMMTTGPLVLDISGQIPVTMQSLVILFSAIVFGWQAGLIATIIYLTAGALGLPVLAGYRSGLQVPYIGFYFGFLAASAVSGYLATTPAFSKALPAILNWMLGHAIILGLGAIWLSQLNPDGWKSTIQDLLQGAILKSLAGALIVQIITRLLSGRKQRSDMSGSDL